MFTFDGVYPFPAYQPANNIATHNRRRAQSVELLLNKFPKLRHLLEKEEDEIAHGKSTSSFEPLFCSTPSFYSGLQLPPEDTFSSTIASTFVDEEYDVGYSSYNEPTPETFLTYG